MKTAALVTTFVLTAGGLVATAAPASADCTYAMCESTRTDLSAPKSIKAGQSLKVCAKVTSRGNVSPHGVLTFTTKGPGGFSKTVKKSYDGGKECASVGKLKKAGKYKVTASFKGGAGFRDSKDAATVTAKKKK